MAETSLAVSRLLGLDEIDVALGGQIRFNAWAQLEGGENNEKAVCIFGGGMFDSGTDGSIRVSTDGQGLAAQSVGESELRDCRREVDHGGLLEPAGQGTQDFWRTGPLWRTMACGRQ